MGPACRKGHYLIPGHLKMQTKVTRMTKRMTTTTRMRKTMMTKGKRRKDIDTGCFQPNCC